MASYLAIKVEIHDLPKQAKFLSHLNILKVDPPKRKKRKPVPIHRTPDKNATSKQDGIGWDGDR